MKFKKGELAQLVRFYSIIFDDVIVTNRASGNEIVIKKDGVIDNSKFEFECFNDNRITTIDTNKVNKRIDSFEDNFSIVVDFVVQVEEEEWDILFCADIGDIHAAQSIIGTSLTNILDMYNEKLYMDSLTDTFNRRYYDEKLKHLQTANGAAMLDIDNFKLINDTYGHLIGDKVLIEVAASIKNLIRNSDAVVRYGGDEFFILFWNIPKDVLLIKLQNIKNKINEISIEEHPELRVSASIGAVHRVDDTDSLLVEADKNLYIAKKDKNEVIM